LMGCPFLFTGVVTARVLLRLVVDLANLETSRTAEFSVTRSDTYLHFLIF
jgi:hypothetical protein